MNPNDKKPNPASQPHGTTQDQVKEMESEGQATKPGQIPSPAPPDAPGAPMPGGRDKRATR